jgi:hypothetical protein
VHYLSGQVPDLRTGAGIKVFWFFSSEKNKDSSFVLRKRKRLLFLGELEVGGHGRKTIWGCDVMRGTS